MVKSDLANSQLLQYCENQLSWVATMERVFLPLPFLILPLESIPITIVGYSMKGKSDIAQGIEPSLAPT